MTCALLIPAAAGAQHVIPGPTAPALTERNWEYSGIEFTANQNSTLTSFTYNNQGSADTILLTDTLGNELQTVSVSPGDPIDTFSVDWSLTAGQSYLLFRTTSSNSLFANWNAPLPSDQDITVLNSGFFSHVYADLGAFPNNLYWSSFTNITTSDVPEPLSWSMMLIGFAAIGMMVRRKSSLGSARRIDDRGSAMG